MKNHHALVVIGAGPAGMAAALTASEHGVDVVLLDEQEGPGGQIYRRAGDSPLPDHGKVLGDDYTRGGALAGALRASAVTHLPDSAVWYLDGQHEIGVVSAGQNRFIGAQRIVIATGAAERPMPLPGWELPGVMGAGAAQVLLKSAAMVPADGVVLAGSGPLLLLLAWQLHRAGVRIGAMLDTTPRANIARALPHLPRALLAPDYLLKGLRLIAALRAAGVTMHRGVASVAAEGEGHIEAVRFVCAGRKQRIATQLLLLHQGVVPVPHLALTAGCTAVWDEAQRCFRPRAARRGRSDVDGIFLAGDGAGICGALASEITGRLAGLEAAVDHGTLQRPQCERLAAPLERQLARHLAIRPFLDALYAPAPVFLRPDDATLVCRCEEVRAGEIRAIARLGCPGPNQAKAFSRCGMGPCQGRQCGATLSELLGEVHGRSPGEIGYLKARPPVKPVTLGALAAGAAPPEGAYN